MKSNAVRRINIAIKVFKVKNKGVYNEKSFVSFFIFIYYSVFAQSPIIKGVYSIGG